MIETYYAVRALRMAFSGHPNVAGYEVPEHLLKGDIWKGKSNNADRQEAQAGTESGRKHRLTVGKDRLGLVWDPPVGHLRRRVSLRPSQYSSTRSVVERVALRLTI